MSLAAVPDEPNPRRMRILSSREVGQRARDPFVLPGLVHANLTGVFGGPKEGKSALTALLVSSALGTGEALGRTWASSPDRVLLLTTDADGAEQYHRRIQELGDLDEFPASISYSETVPMCRADWAELAQLAGVGPGSLVVCDHLTDLAGGDLSNSKEVGTVFRNIERELCDLGAVVVVVGHMTEKAGQHFGRAKTPLGSTIISAKCRNMIFVEKRGAGLQLTTKGGEVADNEVLTVGWGDRGAADLVLLDQATESTKKRLRDKATLDRNAEIADWVVLRCQGKNKTQTAEAIVKQFGGTVGARSKSLQPGRPLGLMLDYKDGLWQRK